MKLFVIDTTFMSRYIYLVEAENENEALEKYLNGDSLQDRGESIKIWEITEDLSKPLQLCQGAC